MANYTLTTSPQEVGRNTGPVVGARLLAWYSDASANSAIVHLKLQAISQGGTYTGTNKDYELTLDNTATGVVEWTYAPLPADTWVDVREITQTVAGGRTVNVSGKVWTYLHGDAWITGNTVTLPNLGTAPSDPTLTSTTTGITTFSGTLSLTSWGVPSSGRFEYYFGTTSSTTENYTYIPVDGSYSTAKTGAINRTGLTPNQGYYIRYRVWNSAYNNPSGLILGGPFVTKAKPATINFGPFTATSVTFNYFIDTDGGYYDKTYEYSLDGGTTWTTFATVSGGSASSGSFNISGLTQGVRYTLQTRVTTTAGTNTAQTYFIIPAVIKTYGSANNVADEINDLYGSANSQAQRITKLYGSSNGVSTLIHQGFGHLNYGP